MNDEIIDDIDLIGEYADKSSPSTVKESFLRYLRYDAPKPGKWKCYLFGSHKNTGIMLQPVEGSRIPNAFQRWCMKIFFDCKWVKEG